MAGRTPFRAVIRPLGLAQHEVEVELRLPAAATARGGVCFLPAWTPGSYLVRDHARLLDRLVLTGPEGEAIPLRKLDKQRWAFPSLPGGGILRYRMLGNELSVRTNHVDAHHAQLIGAATFLGLEGELDRPWRLRFEGWPRGWDIATPLEGRGRSWIAADYAMLVDSPIELGRFALHRWDEAGTAFRLAITGPHQANEGRIVEATQRIVATCRQWFGAFPFPRYLFLLTFSPGARGGLEHRDGCSLLADPFSARGPVGATELERLIAHEFFHAWSVKRLRPAELVPLAYDRENHSTLLWFFEGFTSFAELVICAQAGLMDPQQVLNELGRLWTDHLARAGRHEQSLESASWDAWIRAYKPNEFSANTTVNYYDKGCLVAWMLEGRLRLATQGALGVQDLFRTLWDQVGDGPVTDGQLREFVARLSGKDPAPFWSAFIQGTEDLDSSELEAALGLQAVEFPGGGAWIGLSCSASGILQNVVPGSPAAQAGLGQGMELVAVDGWRTSSPAEFLKVEAGLVPGQAVEVVAAIRGRLTRHRLVPAPAPQVMMRFRPRPRPNAAQQRAFQALFGRDLLGGNPE